MNEVSVNEAFRPIIFRWFILGGALLSLVVGNLGWWVLPPVLAQYFIQAVIVLTAALCLNLIWFVVLFSHGQLIIDRLARIITYVSLAVDFLLSILVFWLLRETYPEIWWLFFWPILITAGLSRLGASFFGALIILPIVYLKFTSPDLFVTTNLNLLTFAVLTIILISRGPVKGGPITISPRSPKPFWQRQKEERATTSLNDSFKTKYEEANRRLYAKDLEVKLIKQELSTLEDAKSKFISVTAHQMRTPLSAVKWTFNILKDGSMGQLSADQVDFVKKGEEATEKMIEIINRLVTVDSIVTVANQANFSPVNLSALVKDTATEFANQVASHHLTLAIKESDGPLPEIMADYAKLKMVLENLLDNAIKYSPDNTTITVTLSDEKINTANSSVIVMVSDQGIGINKKDQAKIFTKFFRAQNAVTKEPDGSGVGLFIAKDIIEEHGGALWFESEEGKGTTFFISLPIKPLVKSVK